MMSWGKFVMILFAVDRKGEQNIARVSRALAVPGIDVNHPVHDRRAALIQRSAARFDAVDGRKILRGLSVPEDFAVDGRIGSQVTVHRPGEGRSRDDGNRLSLRMRTTLFAPSALGRGRRCFPALGAGFDVERGQTARRVFRYGRESGERDIEAVMIRSRAPFDPASIAAGCVALPEDIPAGRDYR